MDEKHLDTESGSNSSDSYERKDEDIGDILSVNGSEQSMDKICVSGATVGKDCSINNENCNTRPDEMGDKSCTASYAKSDMDEFDTINKYETSSSITESSPWKSSCGFTKIHWYFKSKCFRKELKNDTNNCACSYRNSATNVYTSDTPKSFNNMRKRGPIICYLDSLKTFNDNTATNQQTTTTQIEEEYKDKYTILPNTERTSSSFLYNNVYPSDLSSKEEPLIENGVSGTFNTLEDFSGMMSSLDDIIYEQLQKGICGHSFIDKSSNESDISDESKQNFKNNDPVLTDTRNIELCSKQSPIDDESGRKKSLNDFAEVMTCSKTANYSESVRRKASSLKNTNGISSPLDIASDDKENNPNEIDVNQHQTFKRSLSISPTGERESKIMKPSSPEIIISSSSSRPLENVDINLKKRPASPDDKLSPELHDSQAAKKTKIYSS